jgi:phage-related protein
MSIVAAALSLLNSWKSHWTTFQAATTAAKTAVIGIILGLLNEAKAKFLSIVAAALALLNSWKSNWTAIQVATTAAKAAVIGILIGLLTGAKEKFMSIISAVLNFLSSWKTAWTNIYNYIVTKAADIIKTVKEIPTKIITALKNTNLYQTGVTLITNLENGIMDTLNGLLTSVKNKVSEIVKAVSNSGSSMGSGLVSSIKSAGTKAKVSLSEAASGLKRFLPNSPAKEGPFRELPNWDAIFLDPLTKSISEVSKLSVPLSSALSSVRNPLDSSVSSGLNNISNVSTTSNSYGGDTLVLENVNISNGMDVQAIFKQFEAYTANKRRQRGYS